MIQHSLQEAAKLPDFVVSVYSSGMPSSFFFSAPDSGSTGSGSGTGGKNPFRSYPQKFPRARQSAATVVSHLHEMSKKGPRTLIGTVVDTNFHVSQGYVTVTTQLGIVTVLGVPYGTVVPGMRVFVRQMGGAATNRAYVFDGMAPNLSTIGKSGSFSYTNMLPSGTATGLALTTTTGVPTTSSVTSVFGYWWYWFFYLPQLPASTVTLWQMTASSGGNVLTAEYLPTGYLRVRSQDGHGYISNAPLPPHNSHYIVMQPAASTGSMIIDGLAFQYSGITSSGDNPAFTGNGTGYQLSLLSNKDGTALCPLGSWISKFGFGTAFVSGTVIPLQVLGTGMSGIPTADSELPTAIAQTDVTLWYQLLCGDTPGSTTLANSASGGGSSATIATGGAVLATGPY